MPPRLTRNTKQTPVVTEQARSPREIRVSGVPTRKCPKSAGSSAALAKMPKRSGLPDCRRRQYKAFGKAAQRGDGFFRYLTLHAQAPARRVQQPETTHAWPFTHERFSGLGTSGLLPANPRGLGVSDLWPGSPRPLGVCGQAGAWKTDRCGSRHGV